MVNNQPMRILLAENDLNNQLLFREALEGTKIKTQIETVKSGVELINHLLKEDATLPHLIFLERYLAANEGVDSLQEIRKIPAFESIAIVIYSTSTSEQDIEESFVKGANVYLRKPDDFSSLKKILGEVITIYWQYQTSGLNRDNFLLSI